MKTFLGFSLAKIKFLTKFVKPIFSPAVLTLIVAIASLLASYMQWHAMKEQLTEMQLARKSEQRPFIIHKLQNELVEPNKKILFNITSTNYGKSPAKSFLRFQSLFYGVNAEKYANDWFEKYKLNNYDTCGDSIIPPTEGNPFIYRFIESDNILSIKEYEAFKKGTYPIIVVAKEYYSDISCNGYSTETAISYLSNGAYQVIRNNISNLEFK